ncbi:MAG: hypothetical protein PWQ56_413 [Patescibacteria group bacterium]|nr:hypothetical protein [Patescibacteria group bacterium]
MHALMEETENQRKSRLIFCIAINIVFFACIWSIYSTGAIIMMPMLVIVLIFGNIAILTI